MEKNERGLHFSPRAVKKGAVKAGPNGTSERWTDREFLPFRPPSLLSSPFLQVQFSQTDMKKEGRKEMTVSTTEFRLLHFDRGFAAAARSGPFYSLVAFSLFSPLTLAPRCAALWKEKRRAELQDCKILSNFLLAIRRRGRSRKRKLSGSFPFLLFLFSQFPDREDDVLRLLWSWVSVQGRAGSLIPGA